MVTEIEDIIIAQLNGESLSREEEVLFAQWYEQPENQVRYYKMTKLRSTIYANAKAPEIVTEKAWQKFSRPKQLSLFLRHFSKYAAIALIGVSISVAIYWLGVPQQSFPPLTEEVVINAGKKQAILTLSTGQQIVLSDSLSPMTEKNGTNILNTGKQLVYQSNDTTNLLVYNTIRVPRGGEYKLSLSDGSTVWINSESEITYPVAFGQDRREIQLKGEAFFDIHKDHLRPFVVHTEEFDIRVTGTEFNIRTYPGDIASATLTQGSIQLENKNTITRLVPGQQASLIRGQIEVKDVDVEDAVGWRYEVFSFKERRLESLLNEIARWYDIEIFYQNDDVRNLHFTAWFRRSTTIHELIEILEKTQQIKFDLKGKTLTVKKHH